MTRRRAISNDRSAARASRREELLDAAVGAIREQGAGVSMEAIAAAGGVTKPILYKHFSDRDGLAEAIAERFSTGLVSELSQSLEREAAPEELLRSTIDAYLRIVERDPAVYGFLVSRLGSPAGEATQSGLVGDIGRRVAVVLGEQLRLAGQDSGSAEPWAFAIVGMVHMAGDWWLSRGTMTRARLTDELTRLLWQGLGGLGGRAGTPPQVSAQK